MSKQQPSYVYNDALHVQECVETMLGVLLLDVCEIPCLEGYPVSLNVKF